MAKAPIVKATEAEIQKFLSHRDALIHERMAVRARNIFVPLRNEFVGIYERLCHVSLESLPDSVCAELCSFLANHTGYIVSAFIKFSSEGDKAGDLDDIEARLRSVSADLFAKVAPVLAFEKINMVKYEEEVANFEEISEELQKTNRELRDLANRTREESREASELLTQAKTIAADSALSAHAERFDQERVRYELLGRKWLRATLALAALTLVAALTPLVIDYYSILVKSGMAPFLSSWSWITGKILAFSILLTGSVWCGKMYRATLHNSSLNAHRAAALQTFLILAKSAEGSATRDAVLVAATRSIFDIHSTGFSPTSESESSSLIDATLSRLVRRD